MKEEKNVSMQDLADWASQYNNIQDYTTMTRNEAISKMLAYLATQI